MEQEEYVVTPEQLAFADRQFVERHGITARFFAKYCLIPSLLAVSRISCFYKGFLVETLEGPAWKTRLRALRTVLALSEDYDMRGKPKKAPPGTLGPVQRVVIAEGCFETDWIKIDAGFLIRECLHPCLEATSKVFHFYRAKLIDTREFPNHEISLEAIKIAAKLKKWYANEYDNLQFATHRDIAFLTAQSFQNKSKSVQLVRRSQIIYVR